MSKPEVTFQITPEPLEIVVFVDADRWRIETAGEALKRLIAWHQAQERAAIEHDDDAADAADQELYEFIHGLIYDHGDTGLS